AVDALVDLDLPRPRPDGGALVAHALAIDGYGNVALDAERADLEPAGLAADGAFAANGAPARWGRTFADVADGELLLYEDAYRTLALAVDRGSAAERLGLRPDDEVRLERRG
ncbi:MAG TPA: SAM hydroxide adenosyltransferase, partial [Solirubrobacteraceae bacterium]|nr:SAM hydroxide adenosyltransferase [Solirubrobacteraceae bacterium]